MVSEIVEKLYNNPCWGVRQGVGSFLTFEFGKPHLEVIEPLSENKENMKKHQKYRKVTVHGEWHLWIYCCKWELYFDNKLAASDESSRKKIINALKYIDGQKIKKIEIDSKSGDTRFIFDLGGVILTKHYDDSIDEQWLLFESGGNILSIRSDGKYCFQADDAPLEEEAWQNIN